jgi:hypothetical protein
MKRLSLVLFLTLTTLGASQSRSQTTIYDMNYFQTTVPQLVKAHNDLDEIVQIHRKALDNLVSSQAAALREIGDLKARLSKLEGNRLASFEARNGDAR